MERALLEIEGSNIVAIKKWCPYCHRFYYWDTGYMYLKKCPICHGIPKPRKKTIIQKLREKCGKREA